MLRAADRIAVPAALTRTVEREAFLALVLAMLAVFMLRLTPHQLVADSWLALVAGREIVEHGLPAHDTFTVWSRGTTWVDQQWLSQVVWYAFAALGGVKVALLANVVVVTASYAAAAAAARSFGATARSVAFVALPCLFASFWAYQLRAQTLAYPLFVGVLWLLAAASRRPTTRVLLVLPLLVLWANIHGSAVLGSALVVLYGLTVVVGAALRRRGLRTAVVGRATALMVAAPLMLLVSPYGLSVVDYYRSVLLNSTLGNLVVEWQPSAPSPLTAVFFALAFAAVWLVARHGASLTVFERLALAVTLLGGLAALRSIVWFGFTALMLLPTLLDAAAPVRESPKRRLSLVLTTAAVLGVVAASADAARLPATWYSQNVPTGAARVVADAVERDSSVRVFATEPYADLLLWAHPGLRGRVAFDVRFELLTDDEFEKVVDLYELRDGWRRTVDGYDLVVFEPARVAMRDALIRAGGRIAYSDRTATVVRMAGER